MDLIEFSAAASPDLLMTSSACRSFPVSHPTHSPDRTTRITFTPAAAAHSNAINLAVLWGEFAIKDKSAAQLVEE